MALTAPNTQGILTQLQTMLTNLKLADGVTNAYKTVVIGGEKDYTNLLPIATILLQKDESKRFAMGGTIIEPQIIKIRSCVDYSVASTAELQIIAIRDALMPLLQKFVTLQNTMGVYHSNIDKADFGWVFMKPDWFRAHEVDLLVAQYYVIQGGIQS